MGAGNPRFADMERYSPETYYIEAYDYEKDWDFVIKDFVESILDEVKDLGFRMNVTMNPSENVTMSGWREDALTLFEHRYAEICIGTESTPDKIVLAIVPLKYDFFIDNDNSEIADKIEFPKELINDYYRQLESRISEKELDDLDERIRKSYDKYIETVFEPLKDKVVRILYNNYKDCIYFPTSAWTSGKLELKDENQEH